MVVAEQNQDASVARTAVIEWIDHILERKQWTGTDLARKSNLAPSTVLRLLNDPQHRFIPSFKTLQKIADGSGYEIPNSVTRALGAVRTEAGSEEPGTGPERVGSALSTMSPAGLGRRHAVMKVRHVSSLPESLHPISKSDVSVPTPPQLDGDNTAFGFYMPDGALEPWMSAGSLLYATKRRDPHEGDIVLVTDQSGKSRVRLLFKMDEKGLALSKSHPPKADEKMSFDEVKELAIVTIFVKG